MKALSHPVAADLNLILLCVNTNGLTVTLKIIFDEQTHCLRPFSTNQFIRVSLLWMDPFEIHSAYPQFSQTQFQI